MTADLEMHTSEEALPAQSSITPGSRRTGLTLGLVVRRSPGVVLAMAVLLLWVVTAVIGPVFLQHAANAQDLSKHLVPPFRAGHGFLSILGTDTLGRSILARLVVASRTALLFAGLAVLIAAVIGTTLGMISGYFGRSWVDIAIMRLADMLMTVPAILLGLTILYILMPGIWSLVIVLALVRLPVYMRLARAQVLDLRERAFVDVARGLGTTRRRIIFSDLRPLVVPTIGTVAMLELGTTLLNGAGLSFLGVGLQPPTVDWGLMVGQGQSYLQTAWWLSVFPGVAIMLVTFSANIASNWFRSMADPTEMSHILASRKWARARPSEPSPSNGVREDELLEAVQ